MARIRPHSITLKDNTTGRELDFLYAPRNKGLGGKWVRVFQSQKKELIKRCWNLPGFTHKVLNYLEAVVEWRNRIPDPTELATDLKVQRTNVYRAYAELKEVGAILQLDAVYYLNPSLCWKGNEQQLEEAYQTIFRFLRDGPTNPALAGVREAQQVYTP